MIQNSIWDERYSSVEFAYGKAANAYLQEQLAQYKAGSILFPADGEGRNSVFAACQGWDVAAFDLSIEGQKKALLWAEQNKVNIDYTLRILEEQPYPYASFDAIALIYAHFPANIKSDYHQKLLDYLKPGGIVLFEAFSKNHLNYQAKNPSVGGPKDIDMLFSIAEIESDFKALDFIELKEEVIELSEGAFHQGTGSVIRFVGRKR